MRGYLLFLVLLLMVLTNCNRKINKKNSLIIAASSNIQLPLLDIIEQFKAKHDCEIEVSIASSGTLAQQIIQGAPYDLFLSANTAHAEYVYKKLPRQSTKPKNYTLGQLALFTHLNIPNFNISSLTHTDIQSIALPLPSLAPYGQAALESLPDTLYANIKSKFIYTDNTQQTLHYLQGHQVQAAFIHRSALLNPTFISLIQSSHSLYLIPDSTHKPIQQSVTQITHKYKNNSTLSDNFYAYLFTNEAQAIFSKYYYLKP